MILKQIFQLSLAAIGFVANAQQKPFTISGNFKGNGRIYMTGSLFSWMFEKENR